jgi:hypothetical protein
MTTQERALRAIQLARKIKKLGDTPAEYGSEHLAAQSAMAGLAYELAQIILDQAEDKDAA